MRHLVFAAAAAVLAAILPAAALAQSPTPRSDGRITKQEVVTGIINEIERRIIGDYYGRDLSGRRYDYGAKKDKSKGLPPGLAKRGSLPPGLQMQLDERGSLPPGLAKRDLPPDLQASLPRRIGERFFIVDNDIVLVERATGIVLDVIENAVSGGRQGRVGN